MAPKARRVLFAALLLFAPTLVLATGLLGTVPVGAWVVSAARWRGRVSRTELMSALIISVQVLAWAWVWWIVAGRLSRGIRRAPAEGQTAVTVVCAVLIAAVGVLPVYGWAAFGLGWFQSAYHAYAEIVFDVLGYRSAFN